MSASAVTCGYGRDEDRHRTMLLSCPVPWPVCARMDIYEIVMGVMRCLADVSNSSWPVAAGRPGPQDEGFGHRAIAGQRGGDQRRGDDGFKKQVFKWRCHIRGENDERDARGAYARRYTHLGNAWLVLCRLDSQLHVVVKQA